MAPEEFKTAVWQLTRFYPELIKDVYPWYDKNDKGVYVMTNWGLNILKTYEAVYYSSFYRRIFSCYYCTCKCIGNCCSCKGNDTYIRELYNHSCDSHVNDDWLSNFPKSDSLTRQIDNNINIKVANKLNSNNLENFENFKDYYYLIY